MVAARVGTRYPVIGANGGADGFRRIARRTGITATKVHTREEEVLTTEAGVRPGVGTARMGAKATMAVDGAIPSVAPGGGCACRGSKAGYGVLYLGAVAGQNVFGAHRENGRDRGARLRPVPCSSQLVNGLALLVRGRFWSDKFTVSETPPVS